MRSLSRIALAGRVLLILIVLASERTAALAQIDPERRLVVVVAAAGEDTPPWATGAVEQVSAIARELGWAVGSGADQAQAFEWAHSSAPQPSALPDTRAFKAIVSSAVRHLSEQQHTAALAEFDAAFRLYEEAPDAFNRAIAADVLDACLFRVRALLEIGERPQQVESHLEQCRMLLPRDIEPRMVRHATLASAWSRVLAKLQESSGATLEVRCEPGCVVGVNAVPVGHARPLWEATQQVAGSIVRVVGECTEGVPGRVHRLVLRPGPNPVEVDCEFEGALRSRPVLQLLYSSDAVLAERGPAHARAIARALRAHSLLLIRATRGSVAIEALDVATGRANGQATLGSPTAGAEPWPSAHARQVVQDLLGPDPGRVSDLQSAPSPAPSEPRRTRGRRAAITLAVLGTAAYTAAVGLQVAAASRFRSVEGEEPYYVLEDIPEGYASSGRHPDADRGRELGAWASGLAFGSAAPILIAFALSAHELGGYPGWARIAAPVALIGLAALAGAEGAMALRACGGGNWEGTNVPVTCASRDLHAGRATMFGAAALAIALPGISAPFLPRPLSVSVSRSNVFIKGTF